jgi:plasmid stability protein
MPDGQQRWNVWIDEDLMQAMRIAAAFHKMSQKAVTEAALREWLANHPVDATLITDTMTKAAKPKVPSPE